MRCGRWMLAMILVALMLPAASWAADGDPGSTGQGHDGGHACPTCTPSGYTYFNDLRGVNKRQRVAWDIDWNRRFYNYIWPSCKGKTSKMCESQVTIWKPPLARDNRNGVLENDELGNNVKAGWAPNRTILRQIGWINRCHVKGPDHAGREDVFHTQPIDDYERRYCAASQHQSYDDMELKPSSPDGTLTWTQGSYNAVAVRVWRECRVHYPPVVPPATEPDPDTAFYKDDNIGNPGVRANVSGHDTCRSSPLLERTPARDDTDSHPAYFYAHRVFTHPDPSDDPDTRISIGSRAYAAPNAQGNHAWGGVLYQSCRATAPSRTRRAWCGNKRLPREIWDATGDRYNDHCWNGLGSTRRSVDWSDDEILTEVEWGSKYGKGRRRKFLQASKSRIKQWIQDGRKIDGHDSVFPWSKTDGNRGKRDRMCEFLSEHFAIDWSLGAKRSRAKVRFNGVPGRLYAVQFVWLDPRDNILKQTVQLMAANTPSVSNESCPDADTCPTLGALPADPTADFDFSLSSLIGRPTSQKAYSNENAGDGGPTDASWWVPRALKASVFNPRDEPSTTTSWLENHRPSLPDPRETGRVSDTSNPLDGPVPPGRSVWRAPLALIAADNDTLSGSVTSTWKLTNRQPTRQPKADITADRLRSSELRGATLLGESRYITNLKYQMDGSEELASPAYTGWSSLTANACDGAAANSLISSDIFTDRPCTAVSGGTYLKADGSWRLRDAYTVRPAPGRKQVVSTIFHQAQDGPARIKLDAPDRLINKISQVQVWEVADYFDAEDDDVPAFVRTAFNTDPHNPSIHDGYRIDFCQYDRYARDGTGAFIYDWFKADLGEVPHWHSSWSASGHYDRTFGPSPDRDPELLNGDIDDKNDPHPDVNHPLYTGAYYNQGSFSLDPPDDSYAWQSSPRTLTYSGTTYNLTDYAARKSNLYDPAPDTSGWVKPGGFRTYVLSAYLPQLLPTFTNGAQYRVKTNQKLYAYTTSNSTYWSVPSPHWQWAGKGRDWWFSAADLGPKHLSHQYRDHVMVDAPRDGCIKETIPTNAERDADGYNYLRAGDYVVRWLFNDIEDPDEWSILARYQKNVDEVWHYNFTLDDDWSWHTVYSPRAAG